MGSQAQVGTKYDTLKVLRAMGLQAQVGTKIGTLKILLAIGSQAQVARHTIDKRLYVYMYARTHLCQVLINFYYSGGQKTILCIISISKRSSLSRLMALYKCFTSYLLYYYMSVSLLVYRINCFIDISITYRLETFSK